LSILLINKH